MGYRRKKVPAFGARTSAKFAGTCAVSGAPFDVGADLVFTGSGWALVGAQAAAAPGVSPDVLPVADVQPSGGVAVDTSGAPDVLNLEPGALVREFENIGELFARAESPQPSCALGNASRSGGSYDTLTKDFDAAALLARSGWADGCAALADMSAIISQAVRRVVREPVPFYDVCGVDFDIGAVMSGEPECWLDFVHEESTLSGGSVLRVNVMCSFLALVPTEHIVRRGAAICALIHALQFCGFPVEVVATSACSKRDGDTAAVVHRVTVKSAGEPLELDRLAFVLAHPSYLRRMVFALREREGKKHQTGITDRGYGFSCDAPTELDSIFIPCVRDVLPQWSSDAAAVRWVLAELARQGVALEPVAV